MPDSLIQEKIDNYVKNICLKRNILILILKRLNGSVEQKLDHYY